MEKSIMRRENRVALTISALVLVVYAAFRTRNYYWDGILFALTIEESSGVTIKLFNPNHLFGNLLGVLLYWPLHALWPVLRAHAVLSAVNTAASVLACYLLFRVLQRFLHNEYYSACLTLIFAFSATWWKFSTDANVYVPSVLFLVLATDRLTDTRHTADPAAIGLLHAASMLLHQIAIFFFPAVVAALWMRERQSGNHQKVRSVLIYSITASLCVAAAYAWVWFTFVSGIYQGTFWNWITANGHEEWAFASLGGNTWETVRSSVRVFFGGSLSLALKHIDLRIQVVAGAALLVSVIALLAAAVRAVKAWFQDDEFVEAFSHEASNFILWWVGPFFLFQFFWLTQFPYYRLFYLPGGIIGLGLLLKKYGLFQPLRNTHAVPIFLMVLVLSNFTFMIYPYSKAEASPPVRLALEAQRMWGSDVVVYYQRLNGDDAILKYFNPQTIWRPINAENHQAFENDLLQTLKLGKSVWMDTTALDYFNQSPTRRTWLLDHVELSPPWGVSGRKQLRIEFVRIISVRP